MKILCLSLIFILTFLFLTVQATENETEFNRCAFTTLIIGSDPGFIEGAIALGKSLKKVNTKYTRVLLYTKDSISDDKKAQLMHEAGWYLKELAHIIPQPHHRAHKYRFKEMYTKLEIFAQTEFDTLVYLDADTIVKSNIDELCVSVNADIAAVMRGSNFNAGVLVIKPDQDLFDDLVSTIERTPSNYPGNDQGYLNVYFWNFAECTYIDPLEQLLDSERYHQWSCARLPSRYNSDVTLYAVNNNKWPYNPMVQGPETPKIIHYTFVDMKPWDWWAYLITPNVWWWWEVYNEPFESTHHLLFSYEREASGFVYAFIVFLASFFISQKLGGFVDKHVYQTVKHNLVVLMCIFYVFQLMAFWMSYILTGLYLFSPFTNCLIFAAWMNLWMDFIFFNHLDFEDLFKTKWCYFLFLISSMFVLLHVFGEEVTFFVRIGYLVVLFVIFHLMVFPYYFIRKVLVTICDERIIPALKKEKPVLAGRQKLVDVDP